MIYPGAQPPLTYSTVPDWQALSDIPSRGGYAFDGGAAQLEKHADKSALPSSALKQPSSLVKDVSPYRAVAEPVPAV